MGGARGGPDNSFITERGILGLFKEGLEKAFSDSWMAQVAMGPIKSDVEVEKHRWVGPTPGFREHVGGLQAKGLNNYGITITNKDYEDTIEVSTHDLRRDKTGHLPMRMGEMGQQAINLWEELGVAQLELNANGYDGVAFFSASHSIGSSGTMSNLLTAATLPALNVLTPSRPTKSECIDILTQVAAYFFEFRTDQGQKANQGTKEIMILCTPRQWPGFVAAQQELNANGGNNESKALGFTFKIAVESLLAGANVFYAFRTDAPSSRPMIMQEEVAPTIELIGKGSEHEKKNSSIIVIAKCTRGLGLAEFRQALHCTLS
jgi:hypothetical protein